MQRERDPFHRPEPEGPEAWVPPLALAVVQVALVAALVVFIAVVRPMQGRIALPAWTIPASTTFCGLFAIYLLLRVVRNVRAARRGWRQSHGPSSRS